MVAVFGAFALSTDVSLKLIGCWLDRVIPEGGLEGRALSPTWR